MLSILPLAIVDLRVFAYNKSSKTMSPTYLASPFILSLASNLLIGVLIHLLI
ncbi:hypothetical protein SDC9_187529 [bioreactor metagenome]|uniref:Divalent metal cation transporter MntH n=1 Tax=bioreactor metagenome TaxID=1076179 RepID=A0A645HV04_9ZZZZ